LHPSPKRANDNEDDPRRFRMLIDAVVDYAIYMLDPDGIVTTWNPGAERIKGYTAAEVIGTSFERFFTPEDRRLGKPRRALETAGRVGRFESEGWRVRKDGSRFWALVLVDAIRDEEGRLVGFAKITRDMTERRAAEEALRDSERRFRLLVNAVIDYALFMLDRDGRVSSWNAGAERVKGYTAGEILGRHFSCFYTEEQRQRGLPERALETTIREGRFTTEDWRVRKDGSRFWANVVIDPVRDEGGEIIGFAKITRDMTEQREVQRKLEETSEALHQAQKMESLGLLTGGIAHDFNNALAAIVNNLDMAGRRARNDPTLARQIDAALEAASNAAALVKQMMVFARRQPIQPRPIDVNATVEGVVSLLRRALPESIEIAVELGTGVGRVEADPNQLQSSLLNLAVNARDAMPDGGTVTIATTRLRREATPDGAVPAGAFACITVSDTGTGMPPEVRRRAFEPFFTTKPVGKGTGLGLSMVYGTVRQLGGDATIESEAGRGTTVRMYIPAADAAAAALEPAPVETPTQCAEALRLLLVEDDPIVSMATAELLEDEGYAVQSAGRGDEALDILEDNPDIRILVTDIGLPGMNGHELAAAGRSRKPDLKVLFITGYDHTGAADTAAPSPNTAYLAKPYRPEHLFAALQQLCRAGAG
jgi:PAS domain S-box-containing protein